MVLQHQAAQVLQQGQHKDQLRVIAARPQPLGGAPGQPGPLDQRRHRVDLGGRQRAWPGFLHPRGLAHTVQAHHRDGAPQRQDRPAAAAQRTAQPRAVDASQQLEGQAHVLHHHLSQLDGALLVHAPELAGAGLAARHRGQQASAADAVHQHHQRAAAGLAVGLQPTQQRPLESARIAVALALLAVGGPVDDGAQALGHRPHAGARQAHHLAAHRRHVVDHLVHIGPVERRRAHQRMVQHQPHGQHIALGRPAARLQVAARARRRSGHAQAHQAAAAAVGHLQQGQLRIVVHLAGFVGKGQPTQHLHKAGHQVGRRQALLAYPFSQRDAGAPVVGDIGPAVVLAHLHRMGQARMLDPAGLAGVLQPVVQCVRIRQLGPRQGQHQLLADTRVADQPQHGAVASAQQAQQLEPAQVADGLGRRSGGGADGIHAQGQRKKGIEASAPLPRLDRNPLPAKRRTGPVAQRCSVLSAPEDSRQAGLCVKIRRPADRPSRLPGPARNNDEQRTDQAHHRRHL